jgi:hypothetical protein
MRVPLIVHERQAYWIRHLRPRLAHLEARWIESRSLADLERALESFPCPVVLIQLGHRHREALQALVTTAVLAPTALILVVDRERHLGPDPLARELGATHTIRGEVPPPDVAALIDRWVVLATRRAQKDGWLPQSSRDPEPWDIPFLDP